MKTINRIVLVSISVVVLSTNLFGEGRMKEHSPELIGHIQRNEEMWKQWVKHGVNSDTLLELDFFFTTTSKSAKDQLVAKLKDSKTTVKIKETKKGLFSKSYDIQITFPRDKWSLEKIDAMTIYFYELGEKISKDLILDGNGAMIP